MKLPLTGDMARQIFTINTNDPAVKLAVVQTVVLCLVRATLFVSHLQSRGLCMNTRFFFQRTQNGKLADPEEIFAEFDKKCIGLELQTTPLF